MCSPRRRTRGLHGADAPPSATVPGPDHVERLRVPPMTDRLAGWLVTLGVTAIAFALRV